MESDMNSPLWKELTMKRLTATLAAASFVLAVGAPVASAKYVPSSKASAKAAVKQIVRPSKRMPGKRLARGADVRLAKYVRAL
jgi:hypothetical protein